MLGVGEERGVHACKRHGAGRQRVTVLGAAGKQNAALFHRSGALFVSWLGVLPLHAAETPALQVGIQVLSAPKVGIAQTRKPGWSGMVKNKEVLILQVLYEGLEKNAGNRSCERGNEEAHIVLMI